MTKPLQLFEGSSSVPTRIELEVLREICEASHLDFMKLFFREREAATFRIGHHHRVMCKLVDEIILGKRKRVIINVPPGYTKTEVFTIAFVARGLALNPKARFIHTSYSEKLVLDNSVKIRDTIGLRAYQEMWPLKFKMDARAKGLWRTSAGGGLLASPAGGSIIGFRAGTMEPGFTGAFIIDDPLKPDDARSQTMREFVNARYNNTFRSRLAHEDVPIIVVMQRVHPDDLSGYLLSGESNEMWDHLWLPIEVDNSQEYPSEFTHGMPIDHFLPDGPLWKAKHNAEQIEILKLLGEVYDAQYAQRPSKAGGNLFKIDWFERYRDIPALEWRAIYADTAQKTKERNDYSVFQCWGRARSGRAVLLDQIRGKWEAPDLERVAREFWAKHKRLYPNGSAPLRKLAVEDKSSGTGLIQALKKADTQRNLPALPVVSVQRERDKYMRALDVMPHCAAGNVMIPSPDLQLPWLADFEREVKDFDSGPNDDQVDAMVDAIEDILGGAQAIIHQAAVRGHT